MKNMTFERERERAIIWNSSKMEDQIDEFKGRSTHSGYGWKSCIHGDVVSATCKRKKHEDICQQQQDQNIVSEEPLIDSAI